MSTKEISISFRDLLAYTDYLAQRWLKYFRENPGALEVDVGGKTGNIHDLITHIFQVEEFFGKLLSGQMSAPTAPPAKKMAPGIDELARSHSEANRVLEEYIRSATEETMEKMQTMGQTSISNRKILAQTVLHSVHHWAQVAMEVRQAGFPTDRPQDIIISPVMK